MLKIKIFTVNAKIAENCIHLHTVSKGCYWQHNSLLS